MQSAPPDEPQIPEDPPPPVSSLNMAPQGNPPGPAPSDLPGGVEHVAGGIEDRTLATQRPGFEDLPAGGLLAPSSGLGPDADSAGGTPVGLADDDLIDFAPLIARVNGFSSGATFSAAMGGAGSGELSPGSSTVSSGDTSDISLHEPDYLPGGDGGMPGEAEFAHFDWLSFYGDVAPLPVGQLQANGVPLELDTVQGRVVDWSLL